MHIRNLARLQFNIPIWVGSYLEIALVNAILEPDFMPQTFISNRKIIVVRNTRILDPDLAKRYSVLSLRDSIMEEESMLLHLNICRLRVNFNCVYVILRTRLACGTRSSHWILETKWCLWSTDNLWFWNIEACGSSWHPYTAEHERGSCETDRTILEGWDDERDISANKMRQHQSPCNVWIL